MQCWRLQKGRKSSRITLRPNMETFLDNRPIELALQKEGGKIWMVYFNKAQQHIKPGNAKKRAIIVLLLLDLVQNNPACLFLGRDSIVGKALKYVRSVLGENEPSSTDHKTKPNLEPLIHNSKELDLVLSVARQEKEIVTQEIDHSPWERHLLCLNLWLFWIYSNLAFRPRDRLIT